MTHYYDTFPTPFGDFSAAVNERGELVATAFGDVKALRRRFTADKLVRDAHRLATVRQQVVEFLRGQRETFTLPLAPVGTPFQQAVWDALSGIPFGETRSYGELAAALGRPGAARAVGRANATNPLVLIVPCHRVIGRDGALTGFAFGEDLKRRLLAHERVSSPVLV